MSTIFLNENDSIIGELKNYLEVEYLAYIESVIKKAEGRNRIGIFMVSETCKICILPKIIDKYDEEKEEKFLIYIKENLYIINELKNKKIKNVLLDITTDEIGNIRVIEDLISFKYKVLLNNLYDYLFKNIKKIIIEESYSSSIKYNIDIRKNCINIDKSKIYQKRFIENITDSKIDIIYGVLIKVQSKVKNKHNKYINILLKKNLAIIENNFIISNRKINNKLLKNKHTKRLFEDKMIYYILLQLLGEMALFEQEEELYKSSLKLKKIDDFLVDPEILYEYYVYLKLVVENSSFLFARKNEQVKEKYILCKVDEIEDVRTSEPDGLDCKEEIIYDFKWKILKNKSVNEIDFNKLIRDMKIRKIKLGKLIYPKVDGGEFTISNTLWDTKNEKYKILVTEVGYN